MKAFVFIFFLILPLYSWAAAPLDISEDVEISAEDHVQLMLADASQAHSFLKSEPNLAKKISACATKLIEKQYGGITSVVAGASFLQRFLQLSKEEPTSSEIAFLLPECLTILRDFKNNKKIHARYLIEKAGKMALITEFDHAKIDDELQRFIFARLNPKAQCKNSGGASAQAGLFVSLSLGGMSITCMSPYGNRFALRGPSLSAGIGFGASLSANLSNNDSFTFPLYSKKFQKIKVMGDHETFFFGRSVNNLNTYRFSPKKKKHSCRYKSSSLGLYEGVLAGSTFVFKSALEPDYSELFEALQASSNLRVHSRR